MAGQASAARASRSRARSRTPAAGSRAAWRRRQVRRGSRSPRGRGRAGAARRGCPPPGDRIDDDLDREVVGMRRRCARADPSSTAATSDGSTNPLPSAVIGGSRSSSPSVVQRRLSAIDRVCSSAALAQRAPGAVLVLGVRRRLAVQLPALGADAEQLRVDLPPGDHPRRAESGRAPEVQPPQRRGLARAWRRTRSPGRTTALVTSRRVDSRRSRPAGSAPGSARRERRRSSPRRGASSRTTRVSSTTSSRWLTSAIAGLAHRGHDGGVALLGDVDAVARTPRRTPTCGPPRPCCRGRRR